MEFPKINHGVTCGYSFITLDSHMHIPVIPTEGCAEPKNHRNESRLVSVFLTCSSSIYCLPWSRHCVSIEDGMINKLKSVHGLMQPSKERNHRKCLTASEYLLTKADPPGLETCWLLRLLVLAFHFLIHISFPGKPSLISHHLYIQNLHVWLAQSSTIECALFQHSKHPEFLCEPRVVICNLCAFLPVFSHYIQNTGLKFYLRGKQTYANVTSNNY